MKASYFILGAESSGTKMLTKCFVSLGCYGDYTHSQRLDDLDFKNKSDLIVFRRSVPHGKSRKFPEIAKIYESMVFSGYKVFPILIIRDKEITIKSQKRNSHVKNHIESRKLFDNYYEYIFNELKKVNNYPFIVIYEWFVKSKLFRKLIFEQFKLPEPIVDLNNKSLEFKDENIKYFNQVYRDDILKEINEYIHLC